MCSERMNDPRHIAQKRLSEAQDNWLEIVHNHGIDFAEVQSARKELEHARKEYLAVASSRGNGGFQTFSN